MNQLIRKLFEPDYALQRWAEVDLNKAAVESLGSEIDDLDNPLIDPKFQTEYIERLHEQLSIDFSYTPYMEDRSTFWKGHYMMDEDPPRPIHLGIDFNVPANTFIFLPTYGETVFAIHDKDQKGGWGGRVDFFCRQENVYLIFGHLDPSSALHFKGVQLLNGIMIGFVGDTPVNGGWFPHLHLQCVSKEEYERHDDPMKIDGYGAISDDLRERYPNPLSIFNS